MYFVFKIQAFPEKIFTIGKVELNSVNVLLVVNFDSVVGRTGLNLLNVIIHQSALIRW